MIRQFRVAYILTPIEFGGAEKEPAPKVIDVLYPETGVQEDILSSYIKGETPKLKPVEIK